MPTDSVDFYLSFLRERLSILQRQFDDFFMYLGLDDRARKIEHGQLLLKTTSDLIATLYSKGVPSWLSDLQQAVDRYLGRLGSDPANATRSLLEKFIAIAPEMRAQTWDASDADGIDFAAVYATIYRQSRIQELFDNLASELQQIVDSGEIDGIKAIKTFEALIATIRKNSRGDYFASRSTYEIAGRLLKNFGLELLEGIPGLKQATKSVRKTMAEMDIEFEDVYAGMRSQLNGIIKTEMPKLPPLSEKNDQGLPVLEYKPLTLPPAAQVDFGDEVLDAEVEPPTSREGSEKITKE